MANRLRSTLHQAASADQAMCKFVTLLAGEDIPDTLIDGETLVVSVTGEIEEVDAE
jgi:hypothetical protein